MWAWLVGLANHMTSPHIHRSTPQHTWLTHERVHSSADSGYAEYTIDMRSTVGQRRKVVSIHIFPFHGLFKHSDNAKVSLVRRGEHLLSSQIRSHEAAISINCTASMQMKSPGQVHGAYAGINAGFTLSPETV